MSLGAWDTPEGQNRLVARVRKRSAEQGAENERNGQNNRGGRQRSSTDFDAAHLADAQSGSDTKSKKREHRQEVEVGN